MGVHALDYRTDLVESDSACDMRLPCGKQLALPELQLELTWGYSSFLKYHAHLPTHSGHTAPPSCRKGIKHRTAHTLGPGPCTALQGDPKGELTSAGIFSSVSHWQQSGKYVDIK